MSLIRVNHLAKAFKGSDGQVNQVLQSVSFEVKGPTVIGLLGPNGVGKSVTMRLLAALDTPDSGSIEIDGEPPINCRVGYVPPTNPVFGWRRTKDDIGIGMEMVGIPRRERHTHVAALLRRFSIDLPLDQRTHALSSGQRQMVNLARALAGHVPPPLVILDEPWAALSSAVQEEFIRHLESIRNTMDTVIFLSSHQIDSAILACDWILPLRERPVCITQDDLIPVNLPRPRPTNVQQTVEFLELLKHIESVFHGSAPLTV
jgi:ABC-type nitrate/sulfonate/bicarbonate transport system ATPase subunit